VLAAHLLWRQGKAVRAAVRLASGGKLVCGGTVAAVPPGAPPTAAAGRLFFIIDHFSNKKLLVDTGSPYSIFPYQSSKKPFGPRLMAANGQRIRCWGSRRRPLLLAGQEYQWNFT
jgi:hypothetical protein